MGAHDWPSLILVPIWEKGSHDQQCETTTGTHGKSRNVFPMAKEKLGLKTNWEKGVELGVRPEAC